MNYDKYTLSTGWVFLCNNIMAKTILIPQFESRDKYNECCDETECSVYVFFDEVGSKNCFKIALPKSELKGSLIEIDNTIMMYIRKFFQQFIQPCNVWVYRGGD